jgi:hypothetical protein
VLVVESVVFEREETRRGRPNATDSDGRERNASAAATRDGGGGGGGNAMVCPVVNSSPWQIIFNNKIIFSRDADSFPHHTTFFGEKMRKSRSRYR